MKKILLLIFLCAAIGAQATDLADFQNENLTYKVMYKWGLINKQAGTVKIDMHVTPTTYQTQLVGVSAKWADKFFCVRDTLRSEIKREGFLPLLYTKHAHEGDDYTRDRVAYRYQGATVYGDVSSYKESKGKVKRDLTLELEAMGTTLDMLSAFYYMRSLPYQEWKPGHVVSLNIFSGRRKELLTIKYQGMEYVEYDDKKYECYKVTFMFTQDGKTKSSDNMYAWITTAGAHLPVKLEGKLPVGSIKCFLTE